MHFHSGRDFISAFRVLGTSQCKVTQKDKQPFTLPDNLRCFSYFPLHACFWIVKDQGPHKLMLVPLKIVYG